MRHLLITGGTRAARLDAARAACVGTLPVALEPDALPFVRPRDFALPDGRPRTIRIDDVERAFPDAQTGGIRLVLTQSTYLMQAWIDALDDGDRIVVTADRDALQRAAPEAFKARGPWSLFRLDDLESAIANPQSDRNPQPEIRNTAADALLLSRAFSIPAADVRRRMCAEATTVAPASPVAWLALASACREVLDMPAAQDAMNQAASLAPDWAPVFYERGKLWLAYDDMERARDEFQRATALMPTFSAAFSNLGATLGELDDTEGALAAFEHALAHDSGNFTILNNVGVVSRELGRFDESEAALRRVTALAPEFVFGHYNLAHTLFLAGRYRESLAAYEAGRRRDPEKNRHQGCRLAMARFAAGDAAGAEAEFWREANPAPRGERADLLLEAYEIVDALFAAHPALGVHRGFLERLGAEIAKSE